ncbi:uncharacterized protein LOC100893398 [Strongylocentrotus purpuratus]|uniref:Uncharacterized protein n=1 Tax=Strongylocentrotus purpuratus TaxID=7668 RepID=A0A7M7LP55_STRPU|nr:uncharacterized protein LOC100893398 [Strongylocentrotus purpuratus]
MPFSLRHRSDLDDLENAPMIPDLILFFFRTLVGGLQADTGVESSRDVVERKAMALSSDAIFNCSRGNVKPWKHQTIGLGLGALTGSKTLITIMNRFGHCISYDEVKGLETEIAYTCSNCDRETPAGLHLLDALGTGLAWDNYDVNTETLDGKDTLHATVGICYQNELPSEPVPEPSDSKSPGTLSGRKRKSFGGK